MKQMLLYFLCILPFFILSCYDNPTSPDDEQSMPFLWQGALETEPQYPEINWAYFNTELQTSFLWSGASWDTIAISGIDKISIQWLGSFPIPPSPVTIDNAYYNSSDNTSYIFNGTSWDTLATTGKVNLSIQWQGSFAVHPANPSHMWAYYNTQDQTTYVYRGATWTTLAASGMQGVDIVWKGSLEAEPLSPQKNWAYYNSTETSSYLYDGEKWLLICSDGVKGETGNSISWKGSLATPPPYPKAYWAYFNTTTLMSYIFLNDEWQPLTASAKDGMSVVWKGSRTSPPENPQQNWAYYNVVDKCSYIYTSQHWYLLCKDGKSGTDGLSIIWKGTYSEHPKDPQKNWAYYNPAHHKTYLYSGSEWVTICVDGTDGLEGSDGDKGSDGSDAISVISTVSEQYLYPDSALVLNHNSNSNQISFIGQFTTADSVIFNWSRTPHYWDSPYELQHSNDLYNSLDSAPEFKLLQRRDGSMIHYFNETQSAYQGLRYLHLSQDGTLGELQTVSTEKVSYFQALETSGTLCFLYRKSTADSLLMLSKIASDGSQVDIAVSTSACTASNAVALSDGSIFILFSQVDDTATSYCYFKAESGLSEIKQLQYQGSPLLIAPKLVVDKERIVLYENGIAYTFYDDAVHTSTEFLNIVQDRNPVSNILKDSLGNYYLILLEGHGTGKGYRTNFYLCKFSETGERLRKLYLNSYVHPTDLHFLPSGKILLNYSQSHKYTSKRSFKLFVFDTELNICSQDIDLPIAAADAQIAVFNENEFFLTYLDYHKKPMISFANFVKSNKKQQLDLVVVNSNSAKLINNTSFVLSATLSLFGMKEDN